MLDSIEEFRQVHVDAEARALSNVALDLLSCSVCGAMSSKTKARFREAGIEDRCEDLQDGLLNQAVLDIGNAQVPLAAIGLGDGFSASRFRLVYSIQKLLSDLGP